MGLAIMLYYVIKLTIIILTLINNNHYHNHNHHNKVLKKRILQGMEVFNTISQGQYDYPFSNLVFERLIFVPRCL